MKKTVAILIILLALASTGIAFGAVSKLPDDGGGGTSTTTIKEISYLPRNYDWGQFWPEWRNGVRIQMTQDLPLIRDLGANTVRLIIPPYVVGYPQLTPQFSADFEDALTLIASFGFKVHVTLFDFDDFYPHPPGEEIPIGQVIADSQTWLDAIVTPHRYDGRIAVWELYNEIVLYELVNGVPTTTPIPRTHQWLQELFPYLKMRAGNTPCTVSVSWVEWLSDLRNLSTPPDIYNLHWYPNWITWSQPLPKILDRAYQIVGIDKRLMLGEFGCNTYVFSDSSQVNAYRDILYDASQKGVGDIGVWILNDFPPGRRNRDGIILPPSESYNGIYRIASGNVLEPKPVVDLLRNAFQGNLSSSTSPSLLLNASFETLNPYSGVVENWRPWNQDLLPTSWYIQDCTQAHTGSCSAKVTPNQINFIVGLAGTPTLRVTPGMNYTFKGYVKTSLGGIARLSLTWLKEDGGYLFDTDSPPLWDALSWTLLQIQGTVPNDAAHVIAFAKMIDGSNDGITDSVWFDDLQLNYAPILTPIGNKTIRVGNTLTFQISASDPDNDTLTYSVSTLPSGATFDSNPNSPTFRTFKWTPHGSQRGKSFQVTFTVTDPFGGSASETMTIRVSYPVYPGKRLSRL